MQVGKSACYLNMLNTEKQTLHTLRKQNNPVLSISRASFFTTHMDSCTSNTLVTKRVWVFPAPSNSPTPAGYPLI